MGFSLFFYIFYISLWFSCGEDLNTTFKLLYGVLKGLDLFMVVVLVWTHIYCRCWLVLLP